MVGKVRAVLSGSPWYSNRSSGFERIHKSHVVRWSAVKALHASEGSHDEAELRNGTRLPVGRARYKELRAKLG